MGKKNKKERRKESVKTNVAMKVIQKTKKVVVGNQFQAKDESKQKIEENDSSASVLRNLRNMYRSINPSLTEQTLGKLLSLLNRRVLESNVSKTWPCCGRHDARGRHGVLLWIPLARGLSNSFSVMLTSSSKPNQILAISLIDKIRNTSCPKSFIRFVWALEQSTTGDTSFLMNLFRGLRIIDKIQGNHLPLAKAAVSGCRYSQSSIRAFGDILNYLDSLIHACVPVTQEIPSLQQVIVTICDILTEILAMSNKNKIKALYQRINSSLFTHFPLQSKMEVGHANLCIAHLILRFSMTPSTHRLDMTPSLLKIIQYLGHHHARVSTTDPRHVYATKYAGVLSHLYRVLFPPPPGRSGFQAALGGVSGSAVPEYLKLVFFLINKRESAGGMVPYRLGTPILMLLLGIRLGGVELFSEMYPPASPVSMDMDEVENLVEGWITFLEEGGGHDVPTQDGKPESGLEQKNEKILGSESEEKKTLEQKKALEHKKGVEQKNDKKQDPLVGWIIHGLVKFGHRLNRYLPRSETYDPGCVFGGPIRERVISLIYHPLMEDLHEDHQLAFLELFRNVYHLPIAHLEEVVKFLMGGDSRVRVGGHARGRLAEVLMDENRVQVERAMFEEIAKDT